MGEDPEYRLKYLARSDGDQPGSGFVELAVMVPVDMLVIRRKRERVVCPEVAVPEHGPGSMRIIHRLVRVLARVGPIQVFQCLGHALPAVHDFKGGMGPREDSRGSAPVQDKRLCDEIEFPPLEVFQDHADVRKK